MIRKLHWQLLLAFIPSVGIMLLLIYSPTAVGYLIVMDKATYITLIAGLASVVALFCSVSFGFVLFFIQSNRSERLQTYSELKSRLFAFHRWLLSQPDSEDKDLCMSMVFELEKLDLADLPQTNYGNEYRAYIKALEEKLNVPGKREFYLTSTLYSGYIEQLLSRIGIVSIRQIVTTNYLATLTKGLGLLAGLIGVLIAASIWLNPVTTVYFISLSFLFSIMIILFFAEFAYELYRHADEELDFIERDD